jgi:hypothetical protein
MTYDQWKTTDPRDYEPEGPFGSCDCCEARDVPLNHGWTCGIEFYACDACCEIPQRPPLPQIAASDDELLF